MENYEPYFKSSNQLYPTTKTVFQKDLKHWSACDFTIILLFNPASLDPGKTIHAFTGEVLVHVTEWFS